MDTIQFKTIGIIHSPLAEAVGTPIQPTGAKGIEGTIEIFPEYAEALADLAGFSHIIVLFHLHLSRGFSLKTKPFLDDTPRGLFATRSPNRPNPIGLSVVKLDRIEAATLYISNVDIVDGTPLLDIKPYVPDFEPNEMENIRIGWLTGKSPRVRNKKSDRRFLE